MTTQIDLFQIHKYTNQEVFDYVIEKMREQKEKSKNDRGLTFFGVNGTRSPIGWCIPEEKYNPAWDNRHWVSLYEEELITSELYHSAALLSRFESVHDYARVDEWETYFIEIANDLNLNYQSPVPR